MAEAVRGAWAGSDRRFLIEVIRRSIGLLRRRPRSEPGSAVGADAEVQEVEQALPSEDRGRLKAAGARLAELLRSPGGQSWLAKFDAEVDRRLA
jgi:hypothetical protein